MRRAIANILVTLIVARMAPTVTLIATTLQSMAMDHRAADCVYPPIVTVTFVVMIVQVVQNLIVMKIMIHALTMVILKTPVHVFK